MRWYVEITPIGSSDSPALVCVEGSHWQKALQRARRMRGEAEQLSGLSVEFLGQGFRAVDPVLRYRYVVTPAPDDASLDPEGGKARQPDEEAPLELKAGRAISSPRGSGNKRAAAQTVAFSSQGEVKQAVESARAQGDKRSLARTMAFSSTTDVVRGASRAAGRAAVEPSPRATLPSEPPGTPVAPEQLDDAPPPTLDYADRGDQGAAVVSQRAESSLQSAAGDESFRLLACREVEPSAESPLWYGEYVYGMAAPAPLSRTESWLRRRFQAIRQELATRPAGKVVNIALFDHLFDDKPDRPPMITLSWKDWRGEGPEVVLFPYSEADRIAEEAGGPPSDRGPKRAPVSPGGTGTAAEPAPGTRAGKGKPRSQPPAAGTARGPQEVRRGADSAPPAPVGSDVGPPSSRRRRSRRQISRHRSVPPSVPPGSTAPRSQPPERRRSAPPSEPPASEPPRVKPSSSVPPLEATRDASPAPTSEPEPATRPVLIPSAPPVPAVDAPSAVTQRQGSAPPEATPLATPSPPAVVTADMTPEQRARTIPPRPSSPGGPRLAGDDLLTDLFEAMAELHFLNDALEGADFVLALALEKLPCEAGLVSLFDINRRQYVIVRQAGGERSGLLLRLSQRAKLAQQAMRYARAIVVPDAAAEPELVDDRWEQIGVTPRSLLCAPVELSGRYLGLIELANPHDGVAFKETDGHALTYIGRQFAEFVAERGVIVDPDVVLEDIEDEGQ